MSQRTRNHLIEEESRLYFQKSLPSYWVCRNKHEDYGIDCEVEIFDDQGNSTGLVFWVQLKGTDSQAKSKIRKLYFSKDKIKQFRQYDIPVLIIRYSTFDKRIYGRWAGSLTGGEPDDKMVPVYFPDSTLWTGDTISDVPYYLRNQLGIKQGRLNVPLPTFVGKSLEVDETSVPYANLVAIKACLSEMQQHFVLRQNKCDAPLHLLVSNDSIFFSFSDIRLARMKVTFDKLDAKHRDGLSKHILTAFASMLFEFGKAEIANEIIFEKDLFPVILKNEDFLLSILPSLLRGTHFEETMSALEKYIRQNPNDSVLTQLGLKVLLLLDKRNWSPNKLAIVEKFFVRELDFHVLRNDDNACGMSAYNLGNYYKSNSMNSEAVRYFLLARKYYPFYRQAHYYYSDLAGSLFEIGKYKIAAKFYSKSISLGSKNPLVKALFGDALMHAGDYKTAMETFDEYLLQNSDAGENDEWYLKHSMLATLLESGYAPSQQRDTQKADMFTANGHYEKAIESDFLYEPAWYNLGVNESTSNNATNAFVAFTFSALLYRGDPEVWAQSFIHSLFTLSGVDFPIWIIRAAYFHVGQKFIDSVVYLLDQNKIDGESILELIDKTVLDKSQPPITVRVFTGDGVYEELNL